MRKTDWSQPPTRANSRACRSKRHTLSRAWDCSVGFLEDFLKRKTESAAVQRSIKNIVLNLLSVV